VKVRDSGMPEEVYWETLMDVPLILNRLEICGSIQDVVELGCGYGTFTIPVARCIKGTLTALDIEPAMVKRTAERAASEGVRNLDLKIRDVFSEGFGVQDHSQEAVLLFNILHCQQPQALIEAATQVLRPGGKVLVIHWLYDANTPRGPSLEIRPRPEQVVEWAAGSSLEHGGEVLHLPPWHFGLKLGLR